MLSLGFLIMNQMSFADRIRAKFEPPEGKKLFIIGQDNNTIENYIASNSHVPAGFMLYTSIQKLEGLDNESPDYGSGIMHAEELIRKYPNTVLQIGLYMVGALKETYEGRYDGNILRLAAWLKKIKIPVFLRIGYECDGPHNRYNPDDYKKAFRHIVDLLRRQNVYNAAYVWHVHSHKAKPGLNAWYPGDDYVDWVGVSYFDQPQSVIAASVQFANDHKKPVMVAEGTPKGVGSGRGRYSWEAWYGDFFNFINKHEIKAVCYINNNWDEQEMWRGQGWKDARVEANEYVKKQWLKEINKDKYLKSSKELYDSLTNSK